MLADEYSRIQLKLLLLLLVISGRSRNHSKAPVQMHILVALGNRTTSVKLSNGNDAGDFWGFVNTISDIFDNFLLYH